MVKTSRESMIRSVTTVPKALEKETPSCRFNMAQRANSPTRGTTKLAAYDTKIEATRVLFRGCSSSGRGALHPSLGRNRSPYTSKIK